MNLLCENVFTEGQVFNNLSITVTNGVISDIQALKKDQKPTIKNICPAFVDLHINGGEEFHFTASPTTATLYDIETAALKNGVAYTLPTLITSSFENIEKGVAAIKQYKQDNPNTGIIGMHLEGPFLNIKKRGAHLEKYILKPSDELIDRLIKIANGTIKMITIAPELFSKLQITKLIDSGIAVSLGHSNATFAEATAAFDQGVQLITHLFNAMSALGHREPGLVGASLIHDTTYTPIILDDVHVDRHVAKLAYEAKKGKLFLISDALFQNHKKKTFVWEEFNATLQNGNYINADGNLAGATISMADAVINAVSWFNIPLETAIHMATDLPLLAIKETRKIGKIAIGYEAKFCTFEKNLENIKIFNNN